MQKTTHPRLPNLPSVRKIEHDAYIPKEHGFCVCSKSKVSDRIEWRHDHTSEKNNIVLWSCPYFTIWDEQGRQQSVVLEIWLVEEQLEL